MQIRDVRKDDLPQLLTLNQSEVPHLGSLTAESLTALIPLSSHFLVMTTDDGEIAGFLIAMDEASTYQSPNYLWFKARFPTFTYVDRIAIVPAYQRQGLGQKFYDELEGLVKTYSPLIACEVNLQPPNPQSLDFHKKIGFSEAGRQETDGGKKTVSLLVRRIAK